MNQTCLTDDERLHLSVIAVAATNEIAVLLGIIERLTGEKIIPADEAMRKSVTAVH